MMAGPSPWKNLSLNYGGYSYESAKSDQSCREYLVSRMGNFSIHHALKDALTGLAHDGWRSFDFFG
ncbi:MAG: hypothetical protein V1862_02285 [Methanobacteriota archaeon]